ncbi:MAG: DUF1963 domain-containing protein [Armatimonas sp.]
MTAAEALDRIRSFCRPASVAQIGGFRPPENKDTSWFGSNFLGLPGEEWPQGQSAPMNPLLQVRVDELPYCPLPLKDSQLVTVFYDSETVSTPVNNGDGWLIRTYPDIAALKPLTAPPVGSDWPRLFPIKWALVPDDAPEWETSWSLDQEAMDIINAQDSGIDDYGDLPRCYRTKVGGWPTYIQGAPNLDSSDFVLQIASEEKPWWNLVDGGAIYIYCSPQGQWQMHLDFF